LPLNAEDGEAKGFPRVEIVRVQREMDDAGRHAAVDPSLQFTSYNCQREACFSACVAPIVVRFVNCHLLIVN
jgi:hypothetical protein